MKALLLATGHVTDAALGEHHPPTLLPLFDRPFVQHVVEYIAQLGCRDVHVLLSVAPERFSGLLEDGRRWGISITTHLVRDPAEPYERVRAIDLGDPAEPVLLAQANCLPRLPATSGDAPALFRRSDGSWTGWARTTARDLQQAAAAGAAAVEDHLSGAAGHAGVAVDTVLDSRSVATLLAAHQRVFAGGFPELLLTGREVEPGIWLSRNVVLHPTARLVPPVFINPDCQILARAIVGPAAVIGPGSVLDEGAHVRNSLVLGGSYVGAGLELEEALVDRNLLVNARLGASIRIADTFILGSMGRRARRWPRLLAHRLLALALMVLLLPLLLFSLLATRLSRTRHVRNCVRLPAEPDRGRWTTFPLGLCDAGAARTAGPRLARWRHFLGRFLPGLPQVLAGRMVLIGLEPKTADELAAMPADRRELFLRGENGLISETILLYGPSATPDQSYSAETYFAVAASWRRNLRLFLRYLAGLFVAGPSQVDRDPAGD